MATIGNKNVCSARAGRLHALHEVAISAGLSLTFRPRRRLTRATSQKDVLFDAPTGPQMPEANARQRCAPSGAKLFRICLILRSRESGGRLEGVATLRDAGSPLLLRVRQQEEDSVRQSVGKAWWHS